MVRIWKGWSCSLILIPDFRSSPERRFASKIPKRMTRTGVEEEDIAALPMA
jgi:hypothetical protein